MAASPEVDSVRIASMLALVRALAARGGSASPHHAYEWIESNTDLPSRMPPITKLSASEHFEREIRFARQELADAGLLATSQGSWRLLDAQAADMTAEAAREITRQNTRRRREAQRSDTILAREAARPASEPQPTTGPRPVPWEGSVKREIGPASVYLFRFEGSSVWKVGFAANIEGRLREVNRHLPVEVLGRRWLLVRSRPWASSDLAYRMEQRVLALLEVTRTIYERVDCPEAVIDAAWKTAVIEISADGAVPAADNGNRSTG